jgi:hypothetical protein
MTAGTTRRARIIIEGDVREVSGRCGVLRVDLPRDDTGLVPTVMVNPAWAGVSVEDLAPSYNWRDWDVLQDPDDGETCTRQGGRWTSTSSNRSDETDGWATRRVRGGWTVLRYQAGEQ